MLTKDLLIFRRRGRTVRPGFIAARDPELLGRAGALLAIAQGSVGGPQSEACEGFQGIVETHDRPKLTQGLCKLITDRFEIETGNAEVASRRATLLRLAASIRQRLPEGAPLQRYDTELNARAAAQIGSAPAARADAQPTEHGTPAPWLSTLPGALLYADLPDRLPIASFRALSAEALLDRYNLALVQGLLLRARHLSLRTDDHDVLRIRRVLRWLRFQRLVGEVHAQDSAWQIDVTGPAAVFSSSRKYGMQLATFVTAVPLLKRYTLESEVELSRGKFFSLSLDQASPLVSTLQGPAGYLPPELRDLQDRFRHTGWTLQTDPAPRHVGAVSMSVADMELTHTESGRKVYVELFHRWHRGALGRRLADLRTRPDPAVLLGVDNDLLKGNHGDEVRAHPQVFVFRSFPTGRGLAQALDQCASPPAGHGSRGVLRSPTPSRP